MFINTSVILAFENMFEAVPDEYSNSLVFALPIVVIEEPDPEFAVPREPVAVSCKVKPLNASTPE